MATLQTLYREIAADDLRTMVETGVIPRNIAVTGTLSMARSDINWLFNSIGCDAKMSVGPKCDLLIAQDPAGNSSKLQGARRYGIKIMSEEDFANAVVDAINGEAPKADDTRVRVESNPDYYGDW